jgi:EmrB/QacA subfamily drug resistance transporter
MTTASIATAAPGAVRARSPWVVFWIASGAVFLVSLDATVLYAAFGALRAAFPRASAGDVSWVLNAYTVVFAAMLVPAGGLADTYGRKRVFLLGTALFLAASVACGLAPGVGALIAARVAQAIGAALLLPASLSIVLAEFPQSKRAIAVSVWGAVGGLAAAIGPSLGSFVVDSIGWPWAFYLNLPVGAISLWRGAALLTETARSSSRRRVDVVGMALLIIAVGAIALAIVQSNSPAWSRAEIGVVAATGAVAFGAFISWIRGAREPLVDPALFRLRTYSAVNAATFTFGIAFAMMFLGFFVFLTGIWHYSLPRAGIAVTPGPLTVVVVATITGRLAGRLGHRPFLVGGALLYAAAAVWFLLVAGPRPAYLTHWLPAQLLTGAAVGMVMPSLAGAAVSQLPAAHYAVGSAVNQAIRQIGAVIGVAVAVSLIGQATLTLADFTPLYCGEIALALATALFCLPVNTRPRRTEAAAAKD